MTEDILHQVYRAYQKLSRKRQRISVPIDLMIKEAGLWDRKEQAREVLLNNMRMLQSRPRRLGLCHGE